MGLKYRTGKSYSAPSQKLTRVAAGSDSVRGEGEVRMNGAWRGGKDTGFRHFGSRSEDYNNGMPYFS
jgi:hypothetical protein